MSTDYRTIRSYNKHAAAWVKRMRSGENLAHTYLEKPAMYKALPDLKGKTILCMGCGSGEECQHLKSLGARRVIGIDASKELIRHAHHSFTGIEFHVMDMERLKFPPASFDVVYSSLVLEYVPDWLPTLKKVYRVLKPGGTFLFSAHHPIKWALEFNGTKTARKFLWVTNRLHLRNGKYTATISVFGKFTTNGSAISIRGFIITRSS